MHEPHSQNDPCRESLPNDEFGGFNGKPLSANQKGRGEDSKEPCDKNDEDAADVEGLGDGFRGTDIGVGDGVVV